MKISIGIPTIAGRQQYLASALKTCISQDDDALEIVVSDNSPGDARELVASFRDPRVRYIRPPEYLPMSAHWDFMVSHFTGDLVSVVGDDDAVMPGALRRLRAIVAEHGMLPVHHALANYCWPDFPDERCRDKFWFMHPPGQGAVIRESGAFLRQLCSAEARYLDGPMIYHNFIPGDLVRRLQVGGSMFHRSSPDCYSALGIALHTDRFVSTQEVLTITGQSARSNGAAVRMGGADAARFLRDMQLPQYVQRFRSTTVQLTVLDCILEASERYARPELRHWVDWGRQFCAAFNECLDNPSRSHGMRKLATVLADASLHGHLGYVLRDRGTSLLQKAARRVTRGGAPDLGESDQGDFRLGVPSAVPAGVADVVGATLHLDQLLSQRCC